MCSHPPGGRHHNASTAPRSGDVRAVRRSRGQHRGPGQERGRAFRLRGRQAGSVPLPAQCNRPGRPRRLLPSGLRMAATAGHPSRRCLLSRGGHGRRWNRGHHRGPVAWKTCCHVLRRSRRPGYLRRAGPSAGRSSRSDRGGRGCVHHRPSGPNPRVVELAPHAPFELDDSFARTDSRSARHPRAPNGAPQRAAGQSDGAVTWSSLRPQPKEWRATTVAEATGEAASS